MDDFRINVITDDFEVTEVALPGATLGNKPEYSSDWFKANPGEKPPVVIPSPIADKPTWEKMLGYALNDTITAPVAIRFLYEYTRDNFVEILPFDWKSYGVVNGYQGNRISPLTILKVKESQAHWASGEISELSNREKFRLFAIIIAGYRYGIASEVVQGDYKSLVLGKINQVLRNEPYNIDSDLIPTELNRCRVWYNNLEFRTLVTALDMFWVRFPDSVGAKLRVCTLNARFKDCSTISELRHLSEVSSRKVSDVLRYIFSARVQDEMLAVGRSGEEFSDEWSYFPYMRELRLSKKSPYSSSENVHLHNWVAIFGTLLGSERSFNARIVSENGLLASMNLAIFAAYAFHKYASAKIVFGGRTDAEDARAIEKLTHGGSDEEGSGIDPASPLSVFYHMQKCNNVVPPEIMSMFSQLVNRMGTPREKTIVMYLKRNLTN